MTAFPFRQCRVPHSHLLSFYCVRVARRGKVISDRGVLVAVNTQRLWRGHATRQQLKGWTRVVDADGDMFWHNAATGDSVWFPPVVRVSSLVEL